MAGNYGPIMISRRCLVLGAPAVFLLSACKADPAPSSTRTTTTKGALAPTDPVDPAFEGCGHSCGSRSAKDRREARPQPGPNVGDATYCPVSGAVFRIGEKTPKREIEARAPSRQQTLWFCCDSCAAFFSQHEADVLAKRGIA